MGKCIYSPSPTHRHDTPDWSTCVAGTVWECDCGETLILDANDHEWRPESRKEMIARTEPVKARRALLMWTLVLGLVTPGIVGLSVWSARQNPSDVAHAAVAGVLLSVLALVLLSTQWFGWVLAGARWRKMKDADRPPEG